MNLYSGELSIEDSVREETVRRCRHVASQCCTENVDRLKVEVWTGRLTPGLFTDETDRYLYVYWKVDRLSWSDSIVFSVRDSPDSIEDCINDMTRMFEKSLRQELELCLKHTMAALWYRGQLMCPLCYREGR